MLGHALHRAWARAGGELVSTTRATLDLEQPVASALARLCDAPGAPRFGTAILCAAMTDVARCAAEPARSQRINVDGTLELLDGLRERRIRPVFFSSDLVFAGEDRFYREDDEPAPTTLYGRQKLEIERAIRERFESHVIFRTSKLMSREPHPRSILTPLLRALRAGEVVRAFADQWITPAYVEDVAAIARRAGELEGTYHLSTRARLSRHEIARRVAIAIGADPALAQASSVHDVQWSEPRGSSNCVDSFRVRAALGEDALGELEFGSGLTARA